MQRVHAVAFAVVVILVEIALYLSYVPNCTVVSQTGSVAQSADDQLRAATERKDAEVREATKRRIADDIVRFNISLECSSRGRILSNGSCACRAGFFGDQCEQVNWCPIDDCAWYYDHNLEFACHCHKTFDCMHRANVSCPNDCFGHGVCVRGGVCRCDRGFMGVDCSQVHNITGTMTVLTPAHAIAHLRNKVLNFDYYFNYMFHYDVVVFHDGMAVGHQREIQSLTPTTVHFVEISLQPPPHINVSAVDQSRSVGSGQAKSHLEYRGIMRFYSGLSFQRPEMQKYEYAWRMDVDTKLLRPVEYDVFAMMKENGYWMGCIQEGYENHLGGLGRVVYETWPLVRDKYLRPSGRLPTYLSPQFFSTDQDCIEEDTYSPVFFERCSRYNMRVCNCHFEVADMKFFAGKDYTDYWNYLDSTDGWWYREYRDHFIKGLGLAIWAGDTKRWHTIGDIGYWHSYQFNCPESAHGGHHWGFFQHMVPEEFRSGNQF